MTERYRKLPLVTEFEYNGMVRALEDHLMKLESEKRQRDENAKQADKPVLSDGSLEQLIEEHRIFIAWFKLHSKQVQI